MPLAAVRENYAGKPGCAFSGKTVRFALHEVRSDWDELAGGFGFPRQNQLRPCFKCRQHKKLLHSAKLGLPLDDALYRSIMKMSTVEAFVSKEDWLKGLGSGHSVGLGFGVWG